MSAAHIAVEDFVRRVLRRGQRGLPAPSAECFYAELCAELCDIERRQRAGGWLLESELWLLHLAKQETPERTR